MRKVIIELTGGYCNSRCLWCFNQYDLGVKREFIDINNFKKFIDLNQYIYIIPYSHGEALIHPDFVKMMEYALKHNVKPSSIHTNLAMKLTSEHFRVLSDFKSITVNIGGTTQEAHNTNMGTDLNVVMSNLAELIKYNKRITLKMIINKNNAHQVSSLSDVAAKFGAASIALPIYFSVSDSEDQSKIKKFFDLNLSGDGGRPDQRVPCRDVVEVCDGIIKVKTKIPMTCPGLSTTVRYNGAVQVCCRSRKQEGIVGDAFVDPIDKIVNSGAYKQAVVDARRRKYVSYCRYCS
jgi:MoaA/NifB/PqqE/SkfB family radical SAM enzyme